MILSERQKSLIEYDPDVKYEVWYYQVVCNVKNIILIPLCPMLETEQQAIEIAEKLKETLGKVSISNPRYIFNSEKDEGRQEILSNILLLSDWGGYRPEHVLMGIQVIESILNNKVFTINNKEYTHSEEEVQGLEILLKKMCIAKEIATQMRNHS